MMIPKKILTSLVLFSMVFSSSGYAMSGVQEDDESRDESRPILSRSSTGGSAASQGSTPARMEESGPSPVSTVPRRGALVRFAESDPACCVAICVGCGLVLPALVLGGIAGFGICWARQGAGSSAALPGGGDGLSTEPSTQRLLSPAFTGEKVVEKRALADSFWGGRTSGRVAPGGRFAFDEPSAQDPRNPAFIGEKGREKRALAHSRGTSLLGFVSLLSNVRSTGSSDLKYPAKPKSSLRDRQLENKSRRDANPPKYSKNARGKR